jgi:hypothetical protein
MQRFILIEITGEREEIIKKSLRVCEDSLCKIGI